MTALSLFLLSVLLFLIGFGLHVWGGVESHYLSTILPLRPWWLLVLVTGILVESFGAGLLMAALVSILG